MNKILTHTRFMIAALRLTDSEIAKVVAKVKCFLSHFAQTLADCNDNCGNGKFYTKVGSQTNVLSEMYYTHRRTFCFIKLWQLHWLGPECRKI